MWENKAQQTKEISSEYLLRCNRKKGDENWIPIPDFENGEFLLIFWWCQDKNKSDWNEKNSSFCWSFI